MLYRMQLISALGLRPVGVCLWSGLTYGAAWAERGQQCGRAHADFGLGNSGRQLCSDILGEGGLEQASAVLVIQGASGKAVL